ncbi:MAG: hypothetical protein U0263_14105 [Polyangiaceae bacterium]
MLLRTLRIGLVSVCALGSSVACGDDDSSVAGPTGGATSSGGTAGTSGSGAAWPGGGSSGSGGSSGGGGTVATGGVGATGGATGGAGGTGATGGGSGGAGGTSGSGGGSSCPPGTGGSGGPCEFPQGVPDPDFICAAASYQDTDPAVDAAVNSVMASLTGCGVGSDCPITGLPGGNVDEVCQSWFAAVTQALRAKGYCAGQHAVGSTDEIAVSNTGCGGKWYGYHICNYGGPKVVWNPGARRGWWMIKPSYCN